ncbi:MAG TPA: NAD-glutamate dehydrogenase domain-containing protein [Acidimicrobiales bacterium]|nr:NAD-glutamate dehydrogenase domain-containing protein [Acidimicrobiales bacterium]
MREAAPVTGGESQPEHMSWEEQVGTLLAAEGRAALAAPFVAIAPPSYRDQTSPADAALDAIEMAVLSDGAAPAVGPTRRPEAGPIDAASDRAFGGAHRLVVRPGTDPDCTFRIRRYGEHGIELTRLLPVLESFGLVVVESVPHRLLPVAPGGPAVHIDDIGVRTESPDGVEALRFVADIHGPRLVSALEAVSRGDTDVDSLNRLVTVAGLDWRQVALLRVYQRYWAQAGAGTVPASRAHPLVEFPDFARALVGYFQARFDPEVERGADLASVGEAAERARCLAALELVPRLEQDRVLRGFLALVDATLRTNYFMTDASGNHREAIAVKFDSSGVPNLPKPRPRVEAFVHGPEVEGIHLRAGLIARGGLRSSDRPDDFRTEVLDLAFAQVKKNAIIVPTGAKGGFVARRPEDQQGWVHGGPAESRPTDPASVRSAYRVFVESLLDITDNVVGGETLSPPGLIARDGPDPYLVVAADKGTATFSDLANSISEGAGFWLGDAFASGGSRGYDHKRLGITARGAWVAVARHFHQLGIDVQSENITVVGVGDMSGDVFGNGMLQSDHIELVAAFDHRHVFIDPDPDPARAFAERRRLASLERSSWADYSRESISAGGGVWPRDAKSIPLAPSVRRALGLDAEELSPPEVISAILSAPVDLLWFGGIGTFIKAPGESDADVADHANDGVRITSDRVRARVIAEGGNLGITQEARIRYSRRGGRINTDFIDNAAGVATSDREVNLKILLALAIEKGRLEPEARDGYLQRATDHVTSEVLRQVDHSVAALERAVSVSAREPDAYAALIDVLEESGRFDRSVESLPSREELRIRREAGAGLIRPELAVLLAYAKSDLVQAIDPLMVSSGADFLDAVVPYFPPEIRDDFADLISGHRLYPQLAATDVAGELVDQLGIVWAHELAAEVGRSLPEVACAFWASRQVMDAGRLWAELEQKGRTLSADAEMALHAELAGSVSGLARAYLLRPGRIPVPEIVARDRPLAMELAAAAPESEVKSAADRLVDLGSPDDLALRFARTRTVAWLGDAEPVAAQSGRSLADVVETLSSIDRAAGAETIAGAVSRSAETIPPPGRLTLWLGRSVLDDFASWRRAVAAKILSESGRTPDLVAAWRAEHQGTLDGAARMLASTPPGTDQLDSAVLVVRRLQRAL